MTEPAEPEFIAGSEKRFFKFVNGLNEKDKLALISHVADLDGIASAKIANKVLNADYLRFVDYHELNDSLIEELKDKGIKKVVLTDLMSENPDFSSKLEKMADVLWIDHHPFKKDMNSQSIAFLNAQGYCAAYLSYYLFSKIEHIENLDWLAACASISDFAIMKNSDWLSGIYKKYGDKFNPENIRSGKFWELIDDLSLAIIATRPNVKEVCDKIGGRFGDIGDLKKYSDDVRREIDKSVEKFGKGAILFREGGFLYFEAKYPIQSYVSTNLSVNKPDSTLIIAQLSNDVYYISARRQDGKVDVNVLLQKLVEGFENSKAGGHPKASGGHFPKKYLPEFKRRLLKI